MNLNDMTLKQLAEVYNKHADKPIKAFSGSKEAAIARVKAVLPKKAAKEPSENAKPKVGSGAFIREHLAKGKLTPQEILELVHETFPSSRATVKDVYWQRNKMKSEG